MKGQHSYQQLKTKHCGGSDLSFKNPFLPPHRHSQSRAKHRLIYSDPNMKIYYLLVNKYEIY